MNTRTVTVAVSAIGELRKAYERIIRGAKRLEIELTIAGFRPKWETKRELAKRRVTTVLDDDNKAVDQSTSVFTMEVVDVDLDVPEVGATGGAWRVAATIGRVYGEAANGENDVYSRDQELITRFRSAALECEHCRCNRRRVRTIVCREVATGRLKQVGVECGVFYVGDTEKEVRGLEFQELVHVLISPFEDEVMAFEKEGRASAGRAAEAFDAVEAVAFVLKVMEEDGGYSPSKTKPQNEWEEPQPNPNATWRTVLRRMQWNSRPKEPSEEVRARAALNPWDEQDPVLREALRNKVEMAREDIENWQAAVKEWEAKQPTAEQRAKAVEILTWLAGAEAGTEPDDFMANLKAVFEPGWVSSKRLAFGACVAATYERAMRKAAEAANPPTAPAPEGRVGVEGEIIALKWVESDFGAVHKMTVRLASRAKVYCSVPTEIHSPRVGDTIRFKATFTRSDRDPFFAFGKVPNLWDGEEKKPKRRAKAAVVAQEGVML